MLMLMADGWLLAAIAPLRWLFLLPLREKVPKADEGSERSVCFAPGSKGSNC